MKYQFLIDPPQADLLSLQKLEECYLLGGDVMYSGRNSLSVRGIYCPVFRLEVMLSNQPPLKKVTTEKV
jgi:hypothetical protein